MEIFTASLSPNVCPMVQGRSKLFQGGVVMQGLHTACSIYGGVGAAPQEYFVKLDTRKSLPRPQISYVLQFLANRISIVSTRPPLLSVR